MNDTLPTTEMSTQRVPVPRSEATTIEINRAVAEVQAALVVAQQRPRDKSKCIEEMREVCNIEALASRSFFAFKRGGENINGASIHLARELARCWGNINYGVMELSRNDAAGQSEMRAFAWDLQTNAYRSTTFIVEHVRDTKHGTKILTDQRDIYENNANNSARRLRECIYSVLPVWFTEEAKERCRKTIAEGGGVPLINRIANVIEAYANKFGVTKAQLEKRQQRAADHWTAEDYATLRVLYGSLLNNETSVDDEFDRGVVEVPAGADAFQQGAAGQPAEGGKRRSGRPTNAEKAAREAAEKAAADEQAKGQQSEEQQPEQTATIDIVDADGVVLTVQNHNMAINNLRDWINKAATAPAVTNLQKNNAAFIEAHRDLGQTIQNRLNFFVAEERKAKEKADAAAAAAQQQEQQPAGDDDTDDGALPGFDEEPDQPGVDDLKIVLKLADGKDKAFFMPTQKDAYVKAFEDAFTTIAKRGVMAAYNDAIKTHQPEVTRMSGDDRTKGVVPVLREILVKLGPVCKAAAAAKSSSDVH